MSLRLSSFLASIASACQCDEPAPNGGAWDISRTLNYRLGLARLVLGSRGADTAVHPMGSILLQSFTLADGSPCVKANLSWTDQAAASIHAVYAKPGTNWESEARLVAAEWLAGPREVKLAAVPAAAPEAAEIQEPLAAAV